MKVTMVVLAVIVEIGLGESAVPGHRIKLAYEPGKPSPVRTRIWTSRLNPLRCGRPTASNGIVHPFGRHSGPIPHELYSSSATVDGSNLETAKSSGWNPDRGDDNAIQLQNIGAMLSHF